MDTLKNKRYISFDYTSRYVNIPVYFDTLEKRECPGIGSNMITKDIPYVSHRVLRGDTLDSLALKYYNNPTYWWVIAYFNDIQDSFVDLFTRYSVLQIPQIASIKFGREN